MVNGSYFPETDPVLGIVWRLPETLFFIARAAEFWYIGNPPDAIQYASSGFGSPDTPWNAPGWMPSSGTDPAPSFTPVS